MTQDELYMQMALAEARQAASDDEVPVGAVVVCGGKVIARAHNLTETLTDCTAHAEM
uniref:deaminase n=1 Tax=Candidatus Limisoma sp. TaxID=3076476 RepID=UPI003FEF0852